MLKGERIELDQTVSVVLLASRMIIGPLNSALPRFLDDEGGGHRRIGFRGMVCKPVFEVSMDEVTVIGRRVRCKG